MFSQKFLNKVYKNAVPVPFTEQDKFILFSDCHRGDNSASDDFVRNKKIYNFAMNWYYEQGYTYIELGDGEELWENRDFLKIYSAHKDTFDILKKFETSGRLILLYGNHDIDWKSQYNVKSKLNVVAYSNMQVHEGVRLADAHHSDHELFLLHGHQVDHTSYTSWRISRFIVRHFWRRMQAMGFKDPTSPAKGSHKRNQVEKKLIKWTRKNHIPLIAGHTHSPCFPPPNGINYFNTGCCVHPDCICGIEIAEGRIKSVHWAAKPDELGYLKIQPEYPNEGIALDSLFNSNFQSERLTTSSQ